MTAWLLLAPGAAGNAQGFPGIRFALDNGDVNGDADRDLSDGVYLLSYLFSGGAEPVPLALCGTEPTATINGDTNADGDIDISDPVQLLGWLFSAGPAPVPACSDGSGASGGWNPRVIPPVGRILRAVYSALSAGWWQWTLAQPASTNPIEDPDGRYAANDQSGPVWYLAGTSGAVAHRSVTIPRGKFIYFPVVNTVWVTIPANDNYPAGDPPFSEPGAEQFARDAIRFEASILEVELDGKSLNITPAYAIESPVFTVNLPEEDAWAFAPYIDHGGPYPDTVSYGYWVLLAPLSSGAHTLHVRGGTSYGFVTDFTFDITVR
jgi:hypothetical protein